MDSSYKEKIIVKEADEALEGKDLCVEDFTTQQYRELIRLAKQNYSFVFFDGIPFGERFVLWRHDIDFSVNRAFALAEIELDEGVCSTYFINPHSEFYNPFEKSQTCLLKRIVGMGHKIGLHFDAAYHETNDEKQLDEQVSYEAKLLERCLGTRPSVFSFHNPTVFLPPCEEKAYGGLINCQAEFIKEQIPYVSDSNGYWRFRRLREVLENAEDPCLQVLTHPVWWQETPMLPRERILRSMEGRATATMEFYDELLKANNRKNL